MSRLVATVTKGLVRAGPPTDPARNHRFVTLLLFLAVALPWVSAGFGWSHFSHRTVLLARKPWSWSELALVWVFYAQTQLLLLPLALPAALLVAKGWWRTGLALFVTWTVAVFLYTEVERQVYTRTNVHLHEYAKFLRGPDAAKWAGNLDTTRYLVETAMGETFRACAIPLLVGVLGSAALWRYAPRRVASRVLGALVVVLPLSVVAVAPAQWLYRDRHAMQQLHALLPFDFRWSAPLARFADTRKFADPLNEQLGAALNGALPKLYAGVPIDRAARIPATAGAGAAPRPNVVLIVVESLRADALAPDVMPRLCALARRGLTLAEHSAGAKFSHYGLYNLLYARTAIGYYASVLHDVPPQATVTFKGSGYETHFINSADHRRWMSMEKMASERTFDRMQLFLAGTWPACDHLALKETRRLVIEPGAPPRFVCTFLNATHFPYLYPDEFARHAPAAPADWTVLKVDRDKDYPALRNRYRNAAGFIDDRVADLIESIDLARTIVVVTGDHGESLGEDGSLTHGGRWSDPQFRVPCLMFGPGIPAGTRITRPTFHDDVLPTVLHAVSGQTVALAGSTGRDLLAGPSDRAWRIPCAQASEDDFEFLFELNGRRLLLEISQRRPGLTVRGTVDLTGRIDPFDVPPASEVSAWASALAELFGKLTP